MQDMIVDRPISRPNNPNSVGAVGAKIAVVSSTPAPLFTANRAHQLNVAAVIKGYSILAGIHY